MRILFVALFFSIPLLAEPVLEMFPAHSALCEDHGKTAHCPKGAYVQFSDDQRCACLMDGQFTHPRKCMIGPMFCDVSLGQSYSWLHRYENIDGREIEKATGCACVVTKQ